MNCREARRQLWSEPGSTTGAGLELHLRTCGPCAAAASEVQRLQSWMFELPAEEPSAQFDWRLRLRLAQAAQEARSGLLEATSRRFAWRTPIQFVTSAAVAALVVLAVGMIWTRSRGPVTVPSSGSIVVQTPGTPLRSGPGPDVVQVRGGPPPAPLPGVATARSDSDSSHVPQR